MKRQIPKTASGKPRTWLITALLAAVSIAYVIFIFLPVQRSIRELSAELQQKRQELVQAQSLSRPIVHAQQRLAETREVCLQWQAGAPTPSDLAIHFASLTKHAEDAGVVMERFDPQLAAQMQVLSQHNITLQFHGEFPGVFEFLTRLEKLPAAIWFRSLQVSQAQPNDATLQAELTLTIFVDHSDYSD
jgi:Tfp pilus assembly protein PilO